MKVKGWDRFQHFRDRKPPWIKLYRDLLDDIQWHELNPESSKILIMLWLIASESNGELPDTKTLSFRLRLAETKVKQALTALSHWLVQDDDSMISEGYQDDALEREKRESKSDTFIAPIPDNLLKDFMVIRKEKRVGKLTETAFKGIEQEAIKAGITAIQAIELCCKKGWAGFDASWDGVPKPKTPSRLVL